MSDQERIYKLETNLALHQEALVAIRKIVALQDARIANLEWKVLGIKPGPPIDGDL